MEMSEFERSPTTSNGIHRKVSFRDEDLCTACRRDRHLVNGGHNGAPAPLTPVLSCNRRGVFPPVERAVVRTFSIDKMRPVCPVCNPGGDTPNPTGFPQRRWNGNCTHMATTHQWTKDKIEKNVFQTESTKNLYTCTVWSFNVIICLMFTNCSIGDVQLALLSYQMWKCNNNHPKSSNNLVLLKRCSPFHLMSNRCFLLSNFPKMVRLKF